MATEMQTSSRAINGLIRKVKTSATKYNTLVQEAIVAIVRHSNDYGDCTGAARLLDAMPRSNRRQLVVDHFAQYSPINVQRGKDGNFTASLRKPFFDKNETKPNKLYNDYNIEGVKANKWFERPEAERIPDVVDYNSIHAYIMKMLDSRMKKAETCENDNDKAKAKAFVIAVRSAATAFNADTVGDELPVEEWEELDAPARIAAVG